MINIGKSIIKQLFQGVLGLVLGFLLYVGIYYFESFITKFTLFMGLSLLTRIWFINRTYKSDNKDDPETIQE